MDVLTLQHLQQPHLYSKTSSLYRANVPDQAIKTPITTALLTVRNDTIVISEATSLPYVGSITDIPELPWTAKPDASLTQRGTRGPTANEDRADHPAEVCRPNCRISRSPFIYHTYSCRCPPLYQQMQLNPYRYQNDSLKNQYKSSLNWQYHQLHAQIG